jgi:hypothetical protein
VGCNFCFDTDIERETGLGWLQLNDGPPLSNQSGYQKRVSTKSVHFSGRGKSSNEAHALGQWNGFAAGGDVS